MKSSSAAASWGIAGILVACSAFVLRTVQPALADSFASVKQTTDSYALPSPEQVVVGSLGYRSAAADYLFASTRVSYGMHFEEKRRFDRVGDYLDTIMALDPTFRAPYRYADTMLIFQPKKVPDANYRRARDFLEKALENAPDDADLWLQTGQFLAYLAPPYLPPNENREEWRLAGARVLARACDLMGKNQVLPYHCMTAASLFSTYGQRDASIRSLERILAVTDDEEVRRKALTYMREQVDAQAADRVQQRRGLLNAAGSRQLPLVSRTIIQIMGPQFDESACAGRQTLDDDQACATSWRDWSEGLPGELQATPR